MTEFVQQLSNLLQLSGENLNHFDRTRSRKSKDSPLVDSLQSLDSRKFSIYLVRISDGIWAARTGMLDSSKVVVYYYNNPAMPSSQQDIANTIFTWSMIESANIVSCLGVYKMEPTPKIVFEYMNRGNLKIILSRKMFANWALIKTAFSIAKALSYLHERGIVHRSLSSKKVLFNDKYHAKLCGVSSIALVRFVQDCSPLELYAQDIFAFGQLLLEMAEGSNTKGSDPVPQWFTKLAMDCTVEDIKRRPSAYAIANYLERRIKLEEMGSLLKDNIRFLPQFNSANLKGRGTFCCTFLDKYDNNPVAVKHFAPASIDDEIDLYHAAANHARLQSPYIIGFIGFSTGEPMRLVEEFAEQNSLREYLESFEPTNKPSWNSRVKMAWQLAQGVVYLHDQKIAHRHLTPANVLVDGAGNIKIGSMRLATVVDTPIDDDVKCEVGTLLWRAPELINRNVKDLFKADVYAIGLLLVELDTLQQPFIETKLTPQAIVDKVAARRLSPELTPTCPAWYRKLTYLCMCPLPSSRPTAKEIAGVLQEHLNDQG